MHEAGYNGMLIKGDSVHFLCIFHFCDIFYLSFFLLLLNDNIVYFLIISVKDNNNNFTKNTFSYYNFSTNIKNI